MYSISFKKLKFLCIFIITIFLLFILNSPNIEEVEIDKSIFKNGDIILINGKSFKSRIVRLNDHSVNSFSHAGIIKIDCHDIFVIHSTPSKEEGIICESIKQFLFSEDLDNWALFRMKNLTDELSTSVIKSAEYFLKAKIPFDKSFDLSTNDELYCTELIVECYRTINKNLFPMNKGKDYIFPSMFTTNEQFFEVFNMSSIK